MLDVAEVTVSAYQLYAPDMVQRVERIQQLKGQRLTLEEIRERL